MGVCKGLEIYELGYVVALRETPLLLLFVLTHPCHEITCYASIQDSIPFVCQNIDEELSRSSHRMRLLRSLCEFARNDFGIL